MKNLFAQHPETTVGVRGIRDQRAGSAIEAARLLRDADSRLTTAAELQTALSAVTGEDPHAVVQLANDLGVAISWRGFSADGIYDAIFNPQWQTKAVENAKNARSFDYSRFTNAPALSTADAKLGRVLQDYLRQSLPDYMVPSAIMVLAEWPLSPSGKIDRQALPVPNRRTESYIAPRTPQEEALCSIFAEVLSVEQVGLEDDFFSLGGHSLLATRLVSQVRNSFGVDLPLRTLFEAPTVAQLLPHVSRAEKVRAPLVRQARPEHLPTSYAQQRLWFIDQLEGGSTEYNMPAAFRLRGELNLEALRRSISAIVERHEVLRTHFAQVEGDPVQIIEPPQSVPVPLEDLSGREESDQRERVLALMRKEWEQPFDLSHGPLLRIQLIRISERDHVMLWNFHHIVSDGWSQGVFNHEFMALYEAYSEGRENPLPRLPIQYADFALWQRKWLGEDVLRADLEYWKEQLRDIPEELELPKDRPRQAMQTYAADVCSATLPAERVAALHQLSQTSQATLYMTLLSVFAVLLQRYSGQDDIVVGSPIANRQEAQLEKLIGFFVNSLVMRARVNPEASFSELLASVRNTALEAYQHQDVPFERLVEQLSPERSLNRTPIFQVVFAVQNAPMGVQRLKGLEIERLGGDELRVRFDLELHVFEHPTGEIGFYWMYNKGLFDRWRMEQMARHYVTLIESAIQGPDVPLHAMPMLAAEERQMLLEELNATAESLKPVTLLALYEEQVTRTPEAPAIIFEKSVISYSELNDRANRLAHHLIHREIGPESLVGIALRRSPAMIVAMMAVLKSGAAYVPVDLEAPEARLAHMLADSAPDLVITESAQQLPLEGKRLDLDAREVQLTLSNGPSHNPTDAERNATLLPLHPAYVIYTSGSTGAPKGVVVTHEGLWNYLQWSIREYRVGEGNGAPAHSSMSFDLAVTSVYPPLLAGKPVILTPDQHDR